MESAVRLDTVHHDVTWDSVNPRSIHQDGVYKPPQASPYFIRPKLQALIPRPCVESHRDQSA